MDFIDSSKAQKPVHVQDTGPAEMLVSSREPDTPPATVESIYLELFEF